MTPAEIRGAAELLVEDWPDLTPSQVDRLAALLRPARLAS